MALTVNFTPSKQVTDTDGALLYTSYWVAAHNPIVFKLSSSLFPSTGSVTFYAYTSVTESDEGNAVLNFSVDPPPEDFTPEQYIRVAGTIYSGTYRILKWNATLKTIELDLIFNGDDTGNFRVTYNNYTANLKVFAGIPVGHQWSAEKPEEEIEILQQIPNSSNIAVFDIQEAVQRKVTTKNDLAQNSAPNDINIWTGFRVEYEESYDQQVGATGSIIGINAETSNSGKQEFTTDSSLDVVVGDYVVLNNFTDDEYNLGVFKVYLKSGTTLVIDLPFDSGLALNGYETVQKYDTSFTTFSSGYTSEGNQYYAVNAKLPPRSQYGNNLAQYVNTDNKTNAIKLLSGFEDKVTFAGYYDDIAVIIDQTLVDSIGVTEMIALELVEKDINENTLATQIVEIPRKDAGVYRIPFIEGIPPFIYELPTAAIITHVNFVRPAEFSYPPEASDSGSDKTILIDGTVMSARSPSSNFQYDDTGRITTLRDREIFGGRCLEVGVGNAGAYWDFTSLGLTGTMTAIVGFYETNGGTVTLVKSLTGADPEIDNTLKTFTPQNGYRYHDVKIFEGGVLFGRYLMEQRTSGIWLDASGNGNHKAGTGITTKADLWTERNVNLNYANGDGNDLGYSLLRTGGVVYDGDTLVIDEIIPAISATTDAIGGELEYRGRCAYDMKLKNAPALQIKDTVNNLIWDTVFDPVNLRIKQWVCYCKITDINQAGAIGYFDTPYAYLVVEDNGSDCYLSFQSTFGVGVLDFTSVVIPYATEVKLVMDFDDGTGDFTLTATNIETNSSIGTETLNNSDTDWEIAASRFPFCGRGASQQATALLAYGEFTLDDNPLNVGFTEGLKAGFHFQANAGLKGYEVYKQLTDATNNAASGNRLSFTINASDGTDWDNTFDYYHHNQAIGANKFANLAVDKEYQLTTASVITSEFTIRWKGYPLFGYFKTTSLVNICSGGSSYFVRLNNTSIQIRNTIASPQFIYTSNSYSALTNELVEFEVSRTSTQITFRYKLNDAASWTDLGAFNFTDASHQTVGFRTEALGFNGATDGIVRHLQFQITAPTEASDEVDFQDLQTSESDSSGNSNDLVNYLSSLQNGYLPSAVDSSGDSTGLDVEGNQLSLDTGFVMQDFEESLQTNPFNAPILRYQYSVDDTEILTYAQIVQDVDGSGIDRYVKGGVLVEDYIIVETGIATPDDIIDIENYENR